MWKLTGRLKGGNRPLTFTQLEETPSEHGEKFRSHLREARGRWLDLNCHKSWIDIKMTEKYRSGSPFLRAIGYRQE